MNNSSHNGIAGRYRRLFELAGDGILLIQDGRFIDCNPRAAEILGYDTPEELINLHPYDISPEKQPDGSNSKEYSTFLSLSAYEAPILFEWVHLSKQGKPKYLEISLTLFDQKEQSIQVLWRDISDRRKTEKNLVSATKSLQRVGRLAKVGGWEYSSRKNLVYISQQLAEILVIQPQTSISPLKILRMISPSYRKALIRYIKQLVYTEHAEDIDIQAIDRHGKTLWLKVSSEKLNQANEPIFLCGAAQDITEVIQTHLVKEKKEEEVKQGHLQLMKAMSMALEKRDPYTAGHQNKVADLAKKIAIEMRLPSFQIEGLVLGAMLHDMGKIAIPAEILTRPGKLCPEEMNLIKRHAQIGYEILKDVTFPWPIADIVHQHHERFNGSGYPQGLSGKDIRIEAQIIAVADVVEAMAGSRPYRPALGIQNALDELKRGKDTSYHPEVVEACFSIFDSGYKIT